MSNNLSAPATVSSLVQHQGRSETGGGYRYENDAIDLKWVAMTLFSWWRLILAMTVLSILLALFYLFLVTPSYQAKALLLIESKQPKIISGDDVAPGLDTGKYIISQVIESQLQIVRSPRIAERVIRELYKDKKSLSDLQTARQPKNSAPSQKVSGKRAGKSGRVVTQNEVDLFLRGLFARRLGQSLIIQVSYSHKNPKMAAKITNAVATAYLQQQRDVRDNKNSSVRMWLKERLLDLQTSIRKNQKNIESYKNKYGLIDTGGVLLQERELSETVKQSIAAKKNAAEMLGQIQQIRFEQNEDKNAGATALELKSNVISDLKKQSAVVNRKLAKSISRFGENHPDVFTLRAELKNLEEEIRREGERLLENLRNQYKIAVNRSKLLVGRVQTLNKELTVRRKLWIRLEEMKDEAKINNDLYVMLLSRLKQAELRSSLRRADTRIIRRAKQPQKPSRPRKALVLALGLFFGMVGSMGAILIKDMISNLLRSPKDIRKYFGFNKIVSLPALATRDMETKRGQSRALAAYHTRDNTNSDYIQQIFILSEILRKAIKRLQEKSVEKDKVKGQGQVIAMISPNDGEGKTTTAINLINYMSAVGNKALLIDCDMHTAGATSLLTGKSEGTLGEVVAGERDLKEILVTDGDHGSAYCPVVPEWESVRPMDILASDEMIDLLQNLREQYDLIVLDTPSMKPYVDARVLTEEADLIILVAEYEKTSVGDVEDMLQSVAELSQKIDAVVLNKVPISL